MWWTGDRRGINTAGEEGASGATGSALRACRREAGGKAAEGMRDSFICRLHAWTLEAPYPLQRVCYSWIGESESALQHWARGGVRHFSNAVVA